MKRFKTDLFEKGDQTTQSRKRKLTKGQDLIKARKEKMLKLEEGTLDIITGSGDSHPIDSSPTKKISLKQVKNIKSCSSEPIISQEIEADPDDSSENIRSLINLESMNKICRICMLADCDMLNIFRFDI